MKVLVNVKLVNSKFNQAYADKENEGDETEDNIRYIWEDEFELKGNVTSFKVINNTKYTLNGILPSNEEFSFEIPDITLLEFTLSTGVITQLPFSKKAISKTDKVDTADGFTFNLYLKSIKDIVNPMEGAYILKDDYPKELAAFLSEEEEEEE